MRKQLFQNTYLSKYGVVSVISVCLLISAGCTPNKRIMEASEPAITQNGPRSTEPAKSSFETDMEAMRTADFHYIYVFRRKDNTVFTNDDKLLLSSGMPMEINRRKLSDEGKALIVGSNFPMPKEDMKMLTDVFSLENLSKPEPTATPPLKDQ